MTVGEARSLKHVEPYHVVPRLVGGGTFSRFICLAMASTPCPSAASSNTLTTVRAFFSSIFHVDALASHVSQPGHTRVWSVPGCAFDRFDAHTLRSRSLFTTDSSWLRLMVRIADSKSLRFLRLSMVQ